MSPASYIHPASVASHTSKAMQASATIGQNDYSILLI